MDSDVMATVIEQDAQAILAEQVDAMFPIEDCMAEAWEKMYDEPNSEAVLKLSEDAPAAALRVLLRACHLEEHIPPEFCTQAGAFEDAITVSSVLFARAAVIAEQIQRRKIEDAR